MTVQVIRSQVQQDSDLRMKSVNRLQLKAREFEHAPRPRLVFRHIHQLDCRQPDVAANQRRASAGLQDFACQRRSRGLPVRTGDAQNAGLQEPCRQLHLANDRDVEGTRLVHLWSIGRDARTEHDQVLAAEGGMPVAAGFDVHTGIQQRRNVLRQCFRAAQVGNRDLRAAPPEEKCRRKPRNSQPDDKDLLAFKLHERELIGK